MASDHFQCLLVEQSEAVTKSSVASLPVTSLPPGELTLQVEYSSLNYKDALACQGHRGIIKSLPHIPGVDAVGRVLQSASSRFKPGDRVIVTGNDFGQGHWGGWSELARIPEAWAVPLPTSLTPREAMILGTAGFTAAQSVMALQRNDVQPGDGAIAVTGATGGVGSLAVRLLARLGYEVTAVTGKSAQHAALLGLGAQHVVGREEIIKDAKRPMLSATWAGAVDTVGGEMLTSLLRSTQYGGCVTACGLVAGADLSLTVYPFLLRGVTLCGIASADCPYDKRVKIWERLAGAWKPDNLESLVTETDLQHLPEYVDKILAGQVVGRVIVRVTSQPDL